MIEITWAFFVEYILKMKQRSVNIFFKNAPFDCSNSCNSCLLIRVSKKNPDLSGLHLKSFLSSAAAYTLNMASPLLLLSGIS